MGVQHFLQYFCAYQQVVSTSYFFLYPIFILLPHYLRQLPFSPHSIGQDTDTVDMMEIPCLLCQVGHHFHRHLLS